MPSRASIVYLRGVGKKVSISTYLLSATELRIQAGLGTSFFSTKRQLHLSLKSVSQIAASVVGSLQSTSHCVRQAAHPVLPVKCQEL